jgi:cell division protein ZapA
MRMARMVVRIFNREYALKTSGSETDLLRIADIVDSSMREISENTKVVSTERIAVLAALNIADQLIKFKEEKERLERELELRAKKLLRLIDEEEREESKE